MKISPTSNYPKLFYFAERARHLDHKSFIVRWRQHGRLGMSLPRWKNIHRYEQCDSLLTQESKLPIVWCDGVAVVWYESESNRQNHIADRSGQLMKQDEKETFARPVHQFSVLTDETIFKPFIDAPLKLFLQVKKNQVRTSAEFQHWWSAQFGQKLNNHLSSDDLCSGYSENFVRPLALGDSSSFYCDCVEEIACTNIGSCDQYVLNVLDEIQDLENYVAEINGFWTQPVVLSSKG